MTELGPVSCSPGLDKPNKRTLPNLMPNKPELSNSLALKPADGFRKIPLMGANGTADQRIDVAQFYHVNFMRGQEQRLSSIKRKVSIWAALRSVWSCGGGA